MRGALVQLHFVKGRINHRLRFGQPEGVIKLDKYRSLALMAEDTVFGYIRWRANEYGTQDWRVYVLKAQSYGYICQTPGIRPAAKTLVSIHGKLAVKRCLNALDRVEEQASGLLERVPESYWPSFNNALLLRKAPRDLPRNIQRQAAIYAR